MSAPVCATATEDAALDTSRANTCANCARADCETIGLVHMPCTRWTSSDDETEYGDEE